MGRIFENELLERALKNIAEGDISYLNYIYEHYARLLYSVAITIMGDTYSAEDVLHDTFLKFTQVAAQYSPQRCGSAKAWIVAVCRNLCYDRLRSVQRSSPSEFIAVEDNFTAKVHSDIAFLEILAPLNTPDREIVILKIVFGMSHKEIAAALGLTVENTRKRYRRAIEKLKSSKKVGE